MSTHEANQSALQSRPVRTIGITFVVVVGVVVGLFCALSLLVTVLNVMA